MDQDLASGIIQRNGNLRKMQQPQLTLPGGIQHFNGTPLLVFLLLWGGGGCGMACGIPAYGATPLTHSEFALNLNTHTHKHMYPYAKARAPCKQAYSPHRRVPHLDVTPFCFFQCLRHKPTLSIVPPCPHPFLPHTVPQDLANDNAHTHTEQTHPMADTPLSLHRSGWAASFLIQLRPCKVRSELNRNQCHRISSTLN